jgi:O-antigen biosynthesis protein
MRLVRRLTDAFRSPARLAAFLRRVGQVAWRGELGPVLKRVRPRGPTAAEYREWRDAQPSLHETWTSLPFIIALDPSDAASRQALEATLARSAAGAVLVVVRAAQTGWRALSGGEAKALAVWASECRASWIWWIAAGVELAPDAAAVLALGCVVPGARIVYADHEIADEHGEAIPCFKSAWDRVQLLERPYAAPVLAVHAGLAGALEDARETGIAGQWRFLLDAAESLPENAVVHVPRVVAKVSSRSGADDVHDRGAVAPHIARLVESSGVHAATDPSTAPWLRFSVPSACPVSIVIPTRDRYHLLDHCLRSVMADSFPEDGEIVIVDNGSKDPRVAQLLRRFAGRVALNVVSMPVPFNFPKLCNAGVAASRGRVVVLLNNDTEVRTGWLAELASVAARADIGAVGPLLLYPDGIVQSAGVLLGVNRTATSALAGFQADDPVAGTWCASRRRVSAVLGACLAVGRDKYLRVGGMDESFSVSHNELDFCLRLEASGLANVFTPFARVVHEEGGTRGFEVTGAERQRLQTEELLFRARWGTVLEAIDPAHHPSLARAGNPFSLASGDARALPRSGWRPPAPRDTPGAAAGAG